MTPTPQTTGEKLAAISDLISDKELKFGCEVLLKNIQGWKSETIVRRDTMDEEWSGIHINFGDNEIKIVLGTPPDLAKVIYWLRKQNWEDDGRIQDELLYKYWNIEKSLLRDQSEETISFLYDLLCKK